MRVTSRDEVGVAYQTWEQLSQELAARLTRLVDGDTIRLADEPYSSTLQQAPEFLRLETASNHTLPPDRRLTAEQEQQLRGLGWEPPEVPGSPNFWIRVGWPLSGAEALRAAGMMVGVRRGRRGRVAAGGPGTDACPARSSPPPPARCSRSETLGQTF